MAWIVLLCIIVLPVAEIAVFLEVVDAFGLLAAVAGAIIAGLAGIALWRYQGLQTVLRARQAINRGEMPVAAVLDGVWLMLAGLLLILPGFLSDVAALTLLLPPVRTLLAALLVHRLVVASPQPHRPPNGPMVIDADYREVDDDRPER